MIFCVCVRFNSKGNFYGGYLRFHRWWPAMKEGEETDERRGWGMKFAGGFQSHAHFISASRFKLNERTNERGFNFDKVFNFLVATAIVLEVHRLK